MTQIEQQKVLFKKVSFALLIYTILVILWGAWVRISHSGDGCGDSWPLCHGQIIPEAQQGKTWVEFGHRLMSGLFGILVVLIWFKAKSLYKKGEFTRKAAFATLAFMIIEALLGAKLVLFKLVTTNDTPYRAFVMALHQVNSFLLSGSVALLFISSMKQQSFGSTSIEFKKYRKFPWIIVGIGITGAWASLSNSLFPSASLLDGLFEDFSSQSHFLIRLRGLHPLLAITAAGGLTLFMWLKYQNAESPKNQKKYLFLTSTLSFAILFGIATLIFHAPTWMKITHLGLAHSLWIILIYWVYSFKYEDSL